MLTSFFGKSSPLNFLLVSSYIFVIGGLHYFFTLESEFTFEAIAIFLGISALLVFSLLLLDFTIRKNSLTLLNTYGVFLFSCAVSMIPVVMVQPEVVIANLFLLLAFRRMFSMQSPKNTEVKILDTTLWIGVASLFYFWSLLLFIVLFIALFLHPQKRLRHYLIPPLGAMGLFMIATAYHFLRHQSFDWFLNWIEVISFDFSSYAILSRLVFITFLLALLVWTGFSRFADIRKTPRKERPNYFLQLCAAVVCMVVVTVSAEKTGAELLFLVAPASIIISGYIEKKTDLWFKEIILWLFLLLPILFLFI